MLTAILLPRLFRPVLITGSGALLAIDHQWTALTWVGLSLLGLAILLRAVSRLRSARRDK